MRSVPLHTLHADRYGTAEAKKPRSITECKSLDSNAEGNPLIYLGEIVCYYQKKLSIVKYRRALVWLSERENVIW